MEVIMKIALLLVLPLMLAVCMAVPVLDRTLTAPGGDIAGLGYGGGYLWALDWTTPNIFTTYKLDPLTGSIEDSWEYYQDDQRYLPRGLAYINGYVYMCVSREITGMYVAAHYFTEAGVYVAKFSINC